MTKSLNTSGGEWVLMQQTLKRLDLIKTAIAIEDEEIIELQVLKLKTLTIDEQVEKILQLLEVDEYADALVYIEEYTQKYGGVAVYEDKEIGALKLELKVLEKKLQALSEEKNEYLNDINEFNVEYNLQLGEIIRKILELKEELIQREVKQAKGSPEEEALFQEYEEVKKDYKEFNKEYEEVVSQERFELNEEEQKELKKLFRQASRLCHPDIVTDELKEQAHEVMTQLNDAYKQKDLQQVNKILSSLENGIVFDMASDKINNAELLKAKIVDIREQLSTVTIEIREIQEDETFKILQEIDNLDVYFEQMKKQMKRTLEELKISEKEHALDKKYASYQENIEEELWDELLKNHEEAVPKQEPQQTKRPPNEDDDYWGSMF